MSADSTLLPRTAAIITGLAWRVMWVFAMWIFTLAGFFSVVSFLNADLPREIPVSASVEVPRSWPAAVRNHGHYYLWWTVSQRPLMFAFSVAFLLYGPMTLYRFRRLGRRVEQESPPGVAVKVIVVGVLLVSIGTLAVIFLEIVLGWKLTGWPTTY
jgi:small-conductance mechanosensitive channel